MTQQNYQKAGKIMQDLKALTNCKISYDDSEKLKKEVNDGIKKKRESLQNEFDNL